MSSVNFSPKCFDNSKLTFLGFYCILNPVVVKVLCGCSFSYLLFSGRK